MVDFRLSDGVTVPPSWIDISEQVSQAYYLQEQVGHNAWMKKRYAWFTNGEGVEDRIGGDNIFLRQC